MVPPMKSIIEANSLLFSNVFEHKGIIKLSFVPVTVKPRFKRLEETQIALTLIIYLLSRFMNA